MAVVHYMARGTMLHFKNTNQYFSCVFSLWQGHYNIKLTWSEGRWPQPWALLSLEALFQHDEQEYHVFNVRWFRWGAAQPLFLWPLRVASIIVCFMGSALGTVLMVLCKSDLFLTKCLKTCSIYAYSMSE